ncbi:MAG: tetratricopeptide repeat protein [Pirellulales bacterium]|nr:tetratricopeptide repeat protein [Pirellulales bacterium]
MAWLTRKNSVGNRLFLAMLAGLWVSGTVLALQPMNNPFENSEAGPAGNTQNNLSTARPGDVPGATSQQAAPPQTGVSGKTTTNNGVPSGNLGSQTSNPATNPNNTNPATNPLESAGPGNPANSTVTNPLTNPLDSAPAAESAAPASGIGTLPGLPESIQDTSPGTETLPGTGNADQLQAEAQRVMELYRAEKYQEVLDTLDKVDDAQKADPGYWLVKGLSHRMLQQYNEAIAAYTKGIELAPENGDLYLNRGVAWYHNKEYAVAILDFEEAAGLIYADPRPELWKGLSYMELGLPRLAIQSYSQSIKFNNKYIPAHVNRGLAYLSLDEFTPAVLDFHGAIRLNPADARIYFLRGVALARQDRHAQAIASFDTALRLDPKNADAAKNRALSAQKLSQGVAPPSPGQILSGLYQR